MWHLLKLVLGIIGFCMLIPLIPVIVAAMPIWLVIIALILLAKMNDKH